MSTLPANAHVERSVTRPMLTIVPDPEDAEARPARRPRRLVGGLCELYREREDLRGAYAPADYLEEAIRWSV